MLFDKDWFEDDDMFMLWLLSHSNMLRYRREYGWWVVFWWIIKKMKWIDNTLNYGKALNPEMSRLTLNMV